LYAATGDGIVRLDKVGEAWAVELFLGGSGAHVTPSLQRGGQQDIAIEMPLDPTAAGFSA
jgi:hypothetical protein